MSRIADRRRSSEEESGGAYWMDTYGDMVTLLLTFFVFLYSFSTIDSEKWERIVGAFANANSLNVPILDWDTVVSDPIDPVITYRNDDEASSESLEVQMDAAFEELFNNIFSYANANDLQAEILPNPESHAVIVRFNENVLFDSGQAVLLPESRATTNHMINLINENDDLVRMVRIEGHTDNVPINSALYPSNWELSSARSASVLRYFMESGRVNPTKISIGGYGEYQPVEPNDTAEGRAQNRRVDFVIESITLR